MMCVLACMFGFILGAEKYYLEKRCFSGGSNNAPQALSQEILKCVCKEWYVCTENIPGRLERECVLAPSCLFGGSLQGVSSSK